MKLIYSIISAVFFLVLLPHDVDAGVCFNKTQIIYGNGVFNNRFEAAKSRRFLERSLGIRSQFHEIVDLAYANDGGAALTLSGALPAMGQLLELYLQKTLVDNTSNFWHWLDGGKSVPAPQWFLDGAKQISAGLNAVNYVFDGDLQSQVKMYKAYLHSGDRVVIVSHSQGNFYANAAHRLLTQVGLGNNVGIVAVATPAGIVEGGGTHITASEDLVILGVRILALGVGVLPANATNTVKPSNADPFNHNFIKFYMAGIQTRIFIKSAIANTSNRLTINYVPTFDMIPEVVMAGSKVAPAPDGSVYITTGAGVKKLLLDGTIENVMNVPSVDHVGKDGSLYYASPPALPTQITKVNPKGLSSIIYQAPTPYVYLPGTRTSSNLKGKVFEYDVAADGSIYLLNASEKTGVRPNTNILVRDIYTHVQQIDPYGVVSDIAGQPTKPALPFLYSPPGSRLNPNTYYLNIKVAANGWHSLSGHINAFQGDFNFMINPNNGAYYHMPGWQGSPSFASLRNAYDFCPNGDYVGNDKTIGRGVFRAGYSNPYILIGPSSGYYFNYRWAPIQDTIYYANTITGNIEKLVGRPL